jgi:ribulose-5-phosphate 4-epimerase/fuculose-1-phosphate aldolase
MTESQARDEICRVGRSLSVRLNEFQGGGYLITPTDACLGFLDPARLARVDSNARQLSGDLASKTMALHAQIYAAASHFDQKTSCVIHTHSAHCVALTLNPGSAELLPALTPYFVMKVGHVPVVPYHRPGAPEVAQLVAEIIRRYGAAGTPIRAVMLERLGPNVWHESPAAAMATLEELEETARLIVLSTSTLAPLTETQIDELRRVFGARW